MLALAVIAALLSLIPLCNSFSFTPSEAPEPQEATTTDEGTEASVEEDAEARETFVTTWAERIDAYNAGYPLEGYGRTFAEAAYDYGVDPRFSPAIARVESGSGENCAFDHNAWGWGSESWPDWDTAIRAHVSGLAENYGPELTMAVAETYNQANVEEWYSLVSLCMEQIWPSDKM